MHPQYVYYMYFDDSNVVLTTYRPTAVGALEYEGLSADTIHQYLTQFHHTNTRPVSLATILRRRSGSDVVRYGGYTVAAVEYVLSRIDASNLIKHLNVNTYSRYEADVQLRRSV